MYLVRGCMSGLCSMSWPCDLDDALEFAVSARTD